MTFDVLEAFFKGWGALLLGAVGTFLGARAEWRTRREHRWKVEDRKRQEDARAAEEARIAWCKERQIELEVDGHLPIEFDDIENAIWGHDNGYFVLNSSSVGSRSISRKRRY
jgi:hypothetical protein